MFASFKMLAVFLTLGPLCGMVGIPYTAVIGDVTQFYWAVMSIIRMGVHAAGISVEVTGQQNVPAGTSCIFLCNHVSNLDPPVVLPVLPGRTVVLLKRSLMSIPLLGTAMRQAAFIPVDRGSRRDAAQESVRTAALALKAGLHILIFPEGTRSVDGRLSTFKKGPFFLAAETGATIIPVAVSGTETMMRKGSASIHPAVARVQLLAPIRAEDYASREALMAAVHAAIASALPDAMKPEAMKPEAIQPVR